MPHVGGCYESPKTRPSRFHLHSVARNRFARRSGAAAPSRRGSTSWHRLVPNLLRSCSPISIRARRRPSLFVRVRSGRRAIRGSRRKRFTLRDGLLGTSHDPLPPTLGSFEQGCPRPRRRTPRQSSFLQSADRPRTRIHPGAFGLLL